MRGRVKLENGHYAVGEITRVEGTSALLEIPGQWPTWYPVRDVDYEDSTVVKDDGATVTTFQSGAVLLEGTTVVPGESADDQEDDDAE